MEDMTPEGAHRELDRALGNLDEPGFDVLDGQKNPPLLEKDLLPPPEVDQFAIGEIGRNLNKYVTGQKDTVKKPSHTIDPRELVKIPEKKLKLQIQEGISEPKESFDSMEDAVLASVDNRRLNKEEIIEELLAKRNKIEIKGGDRIARLSIGIAVNNLLRESKLIDSDGKGSLRAPITVGGGSTNESSKKPERPERWSVPEAFESELNTMILLEQKNPHVRRALDVFRQFDVATADSAEKLKLKLRGQRASGTFTEEQYKKLLNILEMGDVISGELPYPEGFVAEPPPVVPSYATFPRQTPKKIPEPVAVKPSIVVDHPVITADYIREHGVMYGTDTKTSAVNSSEPLAVEQKTESSPTPTPREKLAQDMSRIAHAEITNPEIAERLQYYIDIAERPLPLKELRAELSSAQDEETSISLIKDSHVLSGEQKAELLSILGAFDKLPEAPPIVQVEDPQSRVKSLNERMSEAVVRAQGVEMSKAAVEKFSTTQYPEPAGPMTKEESEETRERLDLNLREAREVFAKEEAFRKSEVNAHKKLYQKLMAELGVPEKQRPDTGVSEKYANAEKKYKEARKALKDFIANRDVEETEVVSRSGQYSIVENKKTRRIDRGIMNYIEEDSSLLNEMVKKEIPEKERGIITRGLEKWANVPVAARVALSATFFTVVSGGAVSVASGLGAISLRAARGLGGVGGAKFTGIAFDNRNQQKAEEAKQKALEDYATIDGGDEEEKEAQFKEYLQNKEIKEKRDRVKKIAIMTAVGGVSAAATGALMDTTYEAFSNTGSKIHPDISATPKPKTSWLDKFIKKEPTVDQVTVPKTPLVPEKIVQTPVVEQIYVKPVEVELSNKGFIDTIDQLKNATSGQKLTAPLEKLFGQSPQKIAMDLGLYKPGQAAESAFGYKGEQIAIDAEGNVSLMHNTGETEVLMDAKGVFKPYEGKMFDADGSSTSAVPVEQLKTADMPETVAPQPPVAEVAPNKSTSVNEIKSAPLQQEVVLDTATTGAALRTNSVVYQDIEIAKPVEDYKTVGDIVTGKLPLKREFQFSNDSTARTEYSKFFIKTLATMDDATRSKLFDYHLPVQYKGGQINIFQKGPDITILLNGEKIGSTQFINGGFGFQYEKGVEDFAFSAAGKSEYELAFEEAKKAILKNASKFLKTIQ